MSGPQRRTTWDELCRTPILLIPVESRKPWGAETWLNATQPDGPAWVANAPEPITLLDLVRREPQILGQWAHLIFGDDQPVFTKIIRTHFPPFIHMGFRRKVALDAYRKIEALVRALRPFASERAELSGAPVADFDAAARATLTALCDTRAAIVAALHEVDLHQEQGHLLLCGTGVLHSIFGLSHQTHPHDATREPLSRLFAQLARAVKRGAEDEEIEALIQAVDLPLHRARNASAPKNEAWLPLATRAGMVLIEPQQTANCTYSLADFYTPFAWKNGRMIFRKGQPDLGLTHADLVGTLQEVSFAATPLARMRMRPVAVPLSACDAPGATLSRLIDDPVAWPFFTLHQLDLAGGRGRESRFLGDHPEGAFQQIVVLSGRVYLQDAQGQRLTLTPGTPVFIPASMKGGYLLAARERARVLLQSVPVPRGNTPASASTRVAPRFLKTAPVPLTFGTSGLRGLVKDITDIEAYINTCGFLRFLMATTGLRRGSRVAIAGDLRPSTGRILLAVARAILDNGLRI
ncbi:MAG: hypothetical protein MUF51_07500, partial [Vicinamibacteria bacterium]|nr:hypothetical protein [Vicinamibacteria bacterium]